MQLKQIAKLVKRTHLIEVLNKVNDVGETDRLFIGDGYALYETDGLSEMVTEKLLLTIFDIPKDEWGAYRFYMHTESAWGALEDTFSQEDESEAKATGLRLKYLSAEVMPVFSDHGMLLIDPEHLTPIRDEIKKGEVGFFTRIGHASIIVKKGMCVTIAEIKGIKIGEIFEGEVLRTAAEIDRQKRIREEGETLHD